jgi:hypothetical protein
MEQHWTIRQFDWRDGEAHNNPHPSTLRGFLRITMAEWNELAYLCSAASDALVAHEQIVLLGSVTECVGMHNGAKQYETRPASVWEHDQVAWVALKAMNAARQRCAEMIAHWQAQPPQTEGRHASPYAPTEVSVLTKWYRRMVPGGQWMGQEIGITGGFLKTSSECVSSAGLGLSVLKEPQALGLWAAILRDPNREAWYW